MKNTTIHKAFQSEVNPRHRLVVFPVPPRFVVRDKATGRQWTVNAESKWHAMDIVVTQYLN